MGPQLGSLFQRCDGTMPRYRVRSGEIKLLLGTDATSEAGVNSYILSEQEVRDYLHRLNHHVSFLCHFVLLSAPPAPNEVESLVKRHQMRGMIGERNLESSRMVKFGAWNVVVAPAQAEVRVNH